MHKIAGRQAALEASHSSIEQTVAERTAALRIEIAERRQADEAVKTSEQRFCQLAEAIPDVFWMTSPDMREVIYVSPAYEKIWGRTAESLRERPGEWIDAIVEEDRARVSETFRSTLQRERTVSMEYRIRRSDGEVRWIQDHGFSIYDESGRVYRTTGVARDITERKRMEERLLEACKLETVGRLAAGIAHDFNTILTTIIGHAEIIAQTLPAGSPGFQSATQIGKSAERAAQLTQQLLAFSRKQMLQPEMIDLNAAVKDADLMLRRFLGDAIEVRLAINARHPMVKADLGQIREMLVQLASNAQDAMPRGGMLTLETADVTLDENYATTHADVVAGEYVMIAITDTGAGIAAAVKPRVFEPFFTTKPQGEGTGLGLSMCYGIARQAGGHISVYSEVGCGTSFKVFLPRATDAPADPATPLPAGDVGPSRGTETILLVEDDEALRDLAGIVLKKLGYEVHPAANGVEAAAVAGRLNHIDLLLTDVVMPKMNGKELAAALRLSQPLVKVLYTSAYTADAVVHHGILDAGVDFLHKPYTPAALSRKTRETLDAASQLGINS
jgi:PAS domain S-box-containing protein